MTRQPVGVGTVRGCIVIASLFCSLAVAPAPSLGAVTPDAAKQFINGLRGVTIDSLRQSAAGRQDPFITILLANLDIEALTTASLGPLARSATPAEKRDFKTLFAAYVIDTAIKQFGRLQVKTVDIGRTTQQANGDVTVHSRVVAADRQVEMNWRVHDAGGKLKVNDIEIDGISAATHFRNEFERSVSPTVPGLIERLRELTKQSAALPRVQQAFRSN